MPGGGTGLPIWALTASKTTPSHGLRSRGPHTAIATRPPGRRTRRISRAARAGLRHEHETLAAENDVVGAVRLLDALEVQLAGAHVGEPQGVGARRRDRRHLGGHIGQDDLAVRESTRSRRRQPHAPRPARQLEHALARSGHRQLEHLLRHLRAAGVDVVRVLCPRPGHSGPHAVEVRAKVASPVARSGRPVASDALRFHDDLSFAQLITR